MNLSTIILAAGEGTRMKSELAKVLHPVNGKPMLRYAIDAACAAGSQRTIVVIGNGAEQVRQAIGDSVEFVVQEKTPGHRARSYDRRTGFYRSGWVDSGNHRGYATPDC